MKKIFLSLTALALAFMGSSSLQAQKTEKLFNGKDLSNWNLVVDKNEVPGEKVFSVKEGLIRIEGQPFGYMYTKEEYDNYKLHVEWRWPEGKASNSGIFLLVGNKTMPFPTCIECQLHAGDAGDFVLINGSDLKEYFQRRGETRPDFPVVKRYAESSENPAGEWNEANIFVRDGVITVYINGVLQNIGTCLVKKGNIALQSEGGPIEFRNITLTR